MGEAKGQNPFVVIRHGGRRKIMACEKKKGKIKRRSKEYIRKPVKTKKGEMKRTGRI